MAERRRRPLIMALLLAAPLLALAAWIVTGGLRRSFGPAPAGAGGATATTTVPRIEGLGLPEADLPPDRFWERVNGAADTLIAGGCRRMLAWKTDDPRAEVEILVFETTAGAATFLERDAGVGRSSGGPGDEASIAPDSVFFRRGRHFVRVLAGPFAPGSSAAGHDAAAITDLARNVDSALVAIGAKGIP